jgi:hypothetical protein
MSIEKLSIIDHFKDISDFYWKTDKKYGKILKILSSTNSLNTDEFYSLNWHLDEKYDQMLSHLIKKRAMNITGFCDGIIKNYGKDISPQEKTRIYKKTERLVRDLYNFNLIIESSPHTKKNLGDDYFSYELSLNGIFYCIVSWYRSNDFMFNYGSVLANLLKNYADNALFKIFLYPYFEISTLNKFSEQLSINFMVEMDFMLYLSEICKIILKYNLMLYNVGDFLTDGYFHDNLFEWPVTYPEDKLRYDRFFSTSSTLAEFLSKNLGFKWTKNDEITPNYNDDLITIRNSHLKSDAYIRINRSENTVYLKYSGKKFFLKLTKPDRNCYVIYGQSDWNYKNALNDQVRELAKSKLVELIYKLRTKYPKDIPLCIMLNKDEKFRNTVKEIVEKIDLK